MLHTAESVTPSHPDKLADRISDSILDACLEQDPNTRAAIECMGGHGIITITGELTTSAYVDINTVVNKVVNGKYGVQTNIVKQSPDIARGVDADGAGDQGIMIGYACSETPELMPLEVMLARSLCQTLYAKYPQDGKTQVTVDNGIIQSVVASFCNVRKDVLEYEVKKWLGDPDREVDIYCNPAGDWTLGGFEADTGLTGRKIAVDSYGPRVPIGGGAFSGKDATKVDRSGAYMARKIAVDVLRAFDLGEVFVRLAYAIGRAEPLEVTIDVTNEGKRKDDYCLTEFYDNYDFTPNGIIKFLDLKKPQFAETAKWGHFGNGFKWDK